MAMDLKNGYYDGTLSDNGLPCGYGKLTYCHFSVLDCDCYDNKKHRTIYYHHKFLDRYEGDFENGVPCGVGKAHFQNGKLKGNIAFNFFSDLYGGFYIQKYEGEFKTDCWMVRENVILWHSMVMMFFLRNI